MAIISRKIQIEQELLEAISKIANDKKTTEDEIINNILKKEIKGKSSLWDMVGAFTTDEPFSAVEEVRKMRGKE